MLNIFSGMISSATLQSSNTAQLGDSERRKLYLEQSRRERRLAQQKMAK
jgi:hypothetical protein